MEAEYDLLRVVSLIVFLLLAVLGLIHWRRFGGEAGGWLAAAFGAIAIALVTARFLPERSESDLVEGIRKVEVAVLVLFPYFLYRFHLTFFKRRLLIWIPAHILTAAAVFGVFLFRELPEAGETRTTAFQVYVSVVLVQWAFLSVLVAFRLWRAGRGQTPLVGFELRTMASGAALLALALVLAGASNSADDNVTALDVWVQVIVVVSAVLFTLGFWPPPWLRRSLLYARREPLELSRDVTAFAPDRETLAARALRQGLELMGSEEGFISDPAGYILAREGMDGDVIASLTGARPIEGDPAAIPLTEGDRRHAFLAPMPLDGGSGCFAVVSGPYTPFFGADDISRLGDYAALTADALERVRVTERLASVLDSISDLGTGFVVTENGRLVSANDAYVRMTGYSLEELKDMPSLVGLVAEEDRPWVEEDMQKRTAGEPVDDHFEIGLVTKQGEKKHVEVSVKLDRLGERIRLISLVRDVTSRKEAEDMRDRFISDAAHELRTPISTLLGFAELLDGSYPEQQSREIRAGISRAGGRVRVLIKNLLDLSRLQRGVSLDIRSVMVDEMLRSALEASPPPAGVEVDFDSDGGLSVQTDPHRMEEVLSNLLTNAYRYGGSRVVVRARSQDGRVSIAVEDDGPGVEESLVPSLFEPFARGSSSSKAGGSGLGLAIVKGIVEACGGKVAYEQGSPTGARFQIELPGSDHR